MRRVLWFTSGALAVAVVCSRAPIRRFLVARTGTELGQVRDGQMASGRR